MSIFENVGRIGITIPGVLEKAIHVLNEKKRERGGEICVSSWFLWIRIVS
ncbi:hypothetical protein B4119_2029 [Parageobacillus caldoxylosilyticus]|uniref:Uncharacterized protein n=1 Tax=Saccharococcus caldoxylosilyticus TaxID=81408 RepID=A0A150LB62_9BACL|nr:hypothetical protein B4119_2029 [Parageobacillus caldoxylosilyticus]